MPGFVWWSLGSSWRGKGSIFSFLESNYVFETVLHSGHHSRYLARLYCIFTFKIVMLMVVTSPIVRLGLSFSFFFSSALRAMNFSITTASFSPAVLSCKSDPWPGVPVQWMKTSIIKCHNKCCDKKTKSKIILYNIML